MSLAAILSGAVAELALFAGAGFLLFALDDLAVDLIYFTRTAWRAATVYRRYPRAFANGLAPGERRAPLAVFGFGPCVYPVVKPNDMVFGGVVAAWMRR